MKKYRKKPINVHEEAGFVKKVALTLGANVNK